MLEAAGSRLSGAYYKASRFVHPDKLVNLSIEREALLRREAHRGSWGALSFTRVRGVRGVGEGAGVCDVHRLGFILRGHVL